jgi:hypothetical protein
VSKLRGLDETYGAVCSIGSVINEKTLSVLYEHYKNSPNEYLFKNCLLGKDFLWVPINYMVRLSAFESVNPARDIYAGRHPQNIQMFLPLFHSYKCYMAKEPLCKIVVRADSHSHKRKPYEGQLDDLQGFLDIKMETLKRMDIDNKDKWELLIRQHISREKLSLAISYYNYQDAKLFYNEIIRLGGEMNIFNIIKLHLLRFPTLYKLLKRIVNYIK